MKLRRVGQIEFERMRKRLAYGLLALLLLTLVGTLGYYWIGWPEHGWVDAFYMTIITLTTVGYGEVIDLTGRDGARIFTAALLVGGMGIVAYSVPLLAAFLVEGHLHNVFRRRRMQKLIDDMSDHFIVCGSTPSAWHVVEELVRTQREVVVAAPSSEDLEALAAHFESLVIIEGDPSDDDILGEAGIERAAGLVACLESDKDNVIVSLTARRLSPRLRIIAATELPKNEAKMRAAGANGVVSPYRIGGLRIASELVRPTVVSFLDKMLRDKRVSLRVEEVRVPTDGPTGRTLESLDVAGTTGALVLAVLPAGETRFEFNPPPERQVEPGMTLVVMTTAEGRAKLEALLT